MRIREQTAAGVACLGVALAALAAAVWTAATGQIGRQGIDALFQILVCLLVAAAFGPIAFQTLRGFRSKNRDGGS